MKSQGDSTWLQIVLSEGKNREVRRMLARLNHKVLRLRRVAIGPVLLDKLPKGKSRKVSLEELNALRRLVGAEPQSPERERRDRKPVAHAPDASGRRHAPRVPKRRHQSRKNAE